LTAPVATIDHALNGRTRLRIKSMRGDPGYFAGLEEGLVRCEGVIKVVASPRTAGVLITHQADGLPAIAAIARQRGWFELPVSGNTGSFELSPGFPHPDTRLILAGVYGGLAAVQALRGNVLPPAMALFWYALALLPTRQAN
jgi:hypothetical protein